MHKFIKRISLFPLKLQAACSTIATRARSGLFAPVMLAALLGPSVSLAQSVPAAGTVTTVAGGAIAGFKGDGGLATAAQLQRPVGVAVDSAGNIYIADFLNYRVRKVDVHGIITTVAGNGGWTYGGGNYGGDNVPATYVEVTPVSVAVDGAGNLYLSDRDHQRIRMVDTLGTITGVAGDGEVGNSGDGHPATWSGPPGQVGCYTPPCDAVGSSLDVPEGIALDGAGNLYIANTGYGPVRKVAGGIITTFTAGFKPSPFLPGRAIQAWGTAVDSDGNVFITDVANNYVFRADSEGNLTVVAGNGTPGYSGDTGPATGAQLNYPQGVAVDGYGNVYIADTNNGKVRKVTPNGTITTLSAPVLTPMGVAVDSSNNLYIADYGISRILKVQAGIGTTSQTISFPPLADVDYSAISGLQVFLSATASSALPVKYTVTGPATLKSMFGVWYLALTGAGAVTVTAKQSGDESYAQATPVTQTFMVNKALLTVTANNASRPFGAANPPFTYVITGFVNGDTPAVVSGTEAETTTADAASPAGAYPIAFTTQDLTAANYTITYVSGTLTVTGGAAQTISFSPIGSVTYGSLVNLHATASSGLPVSFKVSGGPATTSGSTLTITGVGQVGVVASQAGNGNYAKAPLAAISFNVLPALLTLTANDKTIASGQPLPVFDYSVTGFVNGETAAVLQGSPTASTTATANPAVGTYKISLTQGSLSALNYGFNFVSGTLSVGASASVVISGASVLTNVAAGYQAVVTITNIGTANAANVKLTKASLGTIPGSPLPQSLGTLAAGGGSGTVTVTFPDIAGSAGSTVVERFTGTYTGGTFSVSIRAKLP